MCCVLNATASVFSHGFCLRQVKCIFPSGVGAGHLLAARTVRSPSFGVSSVSMKHARKCVKDHQIAFTLVGDMNPALRKIGGEKPYRGSFANKDTHRS